MKVEMLTVISFSHKVSKVTKSGQPYGIKYYNCLCDCGNECLVSGSQLISKSPTKSCGCARTATNKGKAQDLTGQLFGRLTAVSRDGADPRKWICQCSCGKDLVVLHAHLKNGNSTSCGCKRSETCSEIFYKKHSERRQSLGISEEDYVRDEEHLLRTKFYEYSRKILVRDNFICAWCSQYGGNLNVHHLKFWSSNPGLRFIDSNLVTLCRLCHLGVHKNNFHGDADEVKTILLQGYVNFVEDIQAARIELTPN